MYSFDTRVRYSEINADGELTIGGIVNYFQDCSTFHSEDIGLGLQYLKDQHRVWVLSAWQIVIDEYPHFKEEITVGTWPYDFKGFIGFRNFVLLNKDGKRLAYANSIWSYLDTETGKPVRIGEAEEVGYRVEPCLSMEYEDRRIKLPEGGVKQSAILVEEHHLDTNFHVNNEQYIVLAMKYVPKDRQIRQVRAEYKKSAVLNDQMIPMLYLEEDKVTVALSDETGKPYTIVEFR